jgi:hypothetical protein
MRNTHLRTAARSPPDLLLLEAIMLLTAGSILLLTFTPLTTPLADDVAPPLTVTEPVLSPIDGEPPGGEVEDPTGDPPSQPPSPVEAVSWGAIKAAYRVQ